MRYYALLRQDDGRCIMHEPVIDVSMETAGRGQNAANVDDIPILYKYTTRSFLNGTVR